MIIDPQSARLREAIGAEYGWQRECAGDRRLQLGKRHRKWLTMRYLVQTGQPTPAHLQGAVCPNAKTAAELQSLGLIECWPEDNRTHWLRDWTVTRDGQGAVTWHYHVWAPLDCAPTWGIPILVRLPGNDRWPDRFFAMRGEWRDGELYWITPTSGATYTDRFETGEWRAIP